MDAAPFERVYEAFQDFHDYCAAVFGRKQWRERSGQYLQALLVQSLLVRAQERRNAENLSETVTASPRVLQRFLTGARWDDGVVIGRLQEATSAHSGWLAIPLSGCRRRCGMSPTLREGLASAGMYYVLDLRPDMTAWPLEPTWTGPPYQSNGRPRKPRPRRPDRGVRSGGPCRSAARRCPPEAWRELTIAAGSQGPRTCLFNAQRVRVTHRRKPGEILWAVYRQNRDGSEPPCYLSNAPEDTPLETLAYVGGSRWRIETEFETGKSGAGLDEYETRAWAGWRHHITMCLLAGVFLLTLQQDWGGKDAPGSPGPRCTGWCVSFCHGSGSGWRSCRYGWQMSSNATSEPDSPMRNAAPLARHPQASLPNP